MTAGSDKPPVADSPSPSAPPQVSALAGEIIQLTAADLPLADFLREFLQRVLAGRSAPAGSVWLRTDSGVFEQACQFNPGALGLEPGNVERYGHNDLLRQVIQTAQPKCLVPEKTNHEHNGLSDWALFLTPILLHQKVEGVIEVWQRPERTSEALTSIMGYLVRMADLAAVYLLHQRRQQQAEKTQLWEEFNAFARRVHGSLHPTEVAFLIANEGRQLIGADRLSVALRHGKRVTIEAISGVDLVDQRSNLVRRMRRLCGSVLDWGEKLVYRGVPDESLPPAVLRELDAYLEESHSKLLILLPLRDEREIKAKSRPRSALLLECFETTVPPEQLLQRLEAIAQHTTTSLYNASAYRHIPLYWLWRPVARIQEGLGGKTKAILASVAAALILLVAVLVFVPYPLKMDAKGQLLPQERRWIYSPVDGTIVRFEVEPGSLVMENEHVVLMYDVQLESKLTQLKHEIAASNQDITALGKQYNAAANETDRLRISADKKQKEAMRDRKSWELRTLQERTHSDESRPGQFWLKAPVSGTVLNWDFRENLTNRQVKPSEPLLRIGNKDKRWEVELKIPQKHMGQIVQAFSGLGPEEELEVDLLVISAPTRTFKGKLSRAKLAGEATPQREDADTEPVILASVRIDGPGIAPEDRIPPELLIPGTEVHTKVRCGNRAMGYSLFYGLWEYLYEKVVFFF